MADRRVIVTEEPPPVVEVEREAWVVEEPREQVIVETRRVGPSRVAVAVGQVVGFAFLIVYTLLGIRLVLELVAARPAGFTLWIQRVTDPLYAPFSGILPNIVFEGGYTLVTPLVVALIAYGLLHWAIRRLLRTIAYRPTTV
jgi:hypothetical protein